jgi:hypothetical protein
MKSLAAEMEEFFESEEGKAWIEKKQLEQQHHDRRLEKLSAHLSSLSDEEFAEFISKLINKHDDAYEDRMYSKGVMPHPNGLMSLLFDVAFADVNQTVDPIDEFAKAFPSHTVEYRNFYFGTILGQGTVSRIHSPQKLLIFQL